MKNHILLALFTLSILPFLNGQSESISITSTNSNDCTILLNQANSLFKKGVFKAALTMVDSSLSLCPKEPIESAKSYLKGLFIKGQLRHEMGSGRKSVAALKEALPISEAIHGELHVEHASILGYLGLTYGKWGKYDKGDSLCVKALDILEKVEGKEGLHYGIVLGYQARVLYNRKKKDEALVQYEKALSIIEKATGREHLEFARHSKNLSKIYRDRGQYDLAVPYDKEAMEIVGKLSGKLHPEYSDRLKSLALLYKKLEQFDKAEPLYIESLEIRETMLGTSHEKYIYLLIDFANLYYDWGKYQTALDLMDDALHLVKEHQGTENGTYANSIQNKAVFYRKLGQLELSLPLYLEALEISNRLKDTASATYANRLIGVGLIYGEFGQYAKSLPYLQKAVAIEEKVYGKNHPIYSYGLNNLGGAYYHLGEVDTAISIIEQSLNVFERTLGKKHPAYPLQLSNLAGMYHQSGDDEKALALLFEAKEGYEKVGKHEHPDYINTLGTIGGTYLTLEKFDLSLEYALKQRKLIQKIYKPNHPDYSNNTINTATVNFKKGDLAGAKKHFEESLNLYLNELENYYPYLSEEERLRYFKLLKERFNKFYSFGMHEPQFAQSLQKLSLRIKGLALENSIDARMNTELLSAKDSTTIQLYEEWKSLKSTIEKAYFLSPEKLAIADINLDSMLLAAEALEGKFSRSTLNHTIANSNNQQIQFSDLQAKLKDNEAAIDIVHFEQVLEKEAYETIFYYALISKPEWSEPKFIKLASQEELVPLLSANISANNNRNYLVNPAQNHALYKLIWAPLAPYLDDTKTIYIAPSGILHQVAFEALSPNLSDSKILFDQHEFIHYSSLRDFVTENKNTEFADNAILIGGADYDMDSTSLMVLADQIQTGDATTFSDAPKNQEENILSIRSVANDSTRTSVEFNYLAGTKEEVENIHAYFQQEGKKSTVYVGQQAMEENIKNLEGKNAPGILHIATHGYFFKSKNQSVSGQTSLRNLLLASENPLLRSGLVFSGVNYAWLGGRTINGLEDGVLTAYEISNLDLFNTRLAVLSACETGRGDIHDAEGVFGLQRAFKSAGVEQLIISLWKVPDRETSEMMQLFYQYYLKGKTVKQAFRKAQQKMRKKYEPYYWAAWVLVE